MSVTDPPSTEETSLVPFDLRRTIEVLRRQFWIVLATVVVMTAASAASVALATPIYASSAQLVIEPARTTAETAFRSPEMNEQEMGTQLAIITSEQVAERVRQELGLEEPVGTLLGRVSASRIGNTRVVAIHARDVAPDRAAAVAQGFAEAYLIGRQEEAEQVLDEAAANLRARATGLRQRLEEVEQQIASQEDPPQASIDERESLQAQLGQISLQLNAFESLDAPTGLGQVIRRAAVPQSPIEPQPLQRMLVGLFLGLTAGSALGLMRERLDDRLRDDVAARQAVGAPVLGTIPVAERKTMPAPVLRSPSSPPAEAFRTLRTNLRFASVREPFRSVAVVSADKGEGKSMIAVNLALAAARSGSRVVLVDADLRRPNIHEQFGIPNAVGLSQVLAGGSDLGQAVSDVGWDRLRVVTAGAVPPHPTELIGSDYMTECIRLLEKNADLVIFDAPPVLPVADALELATRVSTTLMVVEVGHSRRRNVRTAMERLRNVHAHVAGAVLNRSDVAGAGYYYAVGTPPEPPDHRSDEEVSGGSVRKG